MHGYFSLQNETDSSSVRNLLRWQWLCDIVCFRSNSRCKLYFLTCYFQSLFPRSVHLRALVLFQQTF